MTTDELHPPALEHDGWDIQVSGPANAERSVLMLPGGLCTHVFYEDLMMQDALAGVRLIAATLPGHGGTAHPADLSLENYAAMASKLAADLGCDVIVGHSMGANVALEMAGSGEFRGPLVLLAPSFSRKDESIVPRDPLPTRPGTGSDALPVRPEDHRPGHEEQHARPSPSRTGRRVRQERAPGHPRQPARLLPTTSTATARSRPGCADLALPPGWSSATATTSG